MSDKSTGISNEQSQILMDEIVLKCEEMQLEPEQILDAISRALLGALIAFGAKDLNVEIESVGSVNATILGESDQESLANKSVD